MNQFKYLIWSGTAVLVALFIFLLASTNQVTNTAATTNTVSFSGEGKVTAKPDVAVIDLSIVTQAATSKDAQDQNSTKSKKVVDFLKKSNVDEKDIKTTGYNIYPQYIYPRVGISYPYDGNPKISGYQVTESIQVKIRDLDKASNILDGVVSAGANQVGQLTFQIDDPEKLKSEAREKAVADAKKKAHDLQKQIGIKLGKIVNFSENTGGYPIPMYYDKAIPAGAGGMGGGPSLPSGENEINISVTLTYQIK